METSCDAGDDGGELSLKAACCACITELVVNDTNGQQLAVSLVHIGTYIHVQ